MPRFSKLSTKSSSSTAAAKLPKNVFQAFDEEDESVSRPQTPPMPHEEFILRARFWVSSADEENWPCRCTDPAHALEDNGSFCCAHGRWQMVSSWQEALDARTALCQTPHSSEDCLGCCHQHPMLTGIQAELRAAELSGGYWSDIVCATEDHMSEEERAYHAAETAEAFARLEAAAQKDKVVLAKSLAVDKVAAVRREVKVSGLRRKYHYQTGLPMACRHFAFQGVLGRIAPSDGVHPEGCMLHREGLCSFFHPEEAEWKIITGEVQPTPTSADRFACLSSRPGGRQQIPCRFFRQGRCTKGPACTFLHI